MNRIERIALTLAGVIIGALIVYGGGVHLTIGWDDAPPALSASMAESEVVDATLTPAASVTTTATPAASEPVKLGTKPIPIPETMPVVPPGPSAYDQRLASALVQISEVNTRQNIAIGLLTKAIAPSGVIDDGTTWTLHASPAGGFEVRGRK